ncbi:MAG: hypothetical protein MJZ87_07995 [Bacteroidales bacterium]|nr:hypothetical protein [Bacteroidales bacterium]
MRTTKFASGAPIYYSSQCNIPEFQMNNGNYFYNAYAVLLSQKNFVENNQGICPEGWHIPSIAEWQVLLQNVLGDELLADGNNHSGFSAQAVGFFIGSRYYNSDACGFATAQASATQASSNGYDFTTITLNDGRSGTSAYGTRYVPVRCIKGAGVTFTPIVETDQVKGVDGREIEATKADLYYWLRSDGGETSIQTGVSYSMNSDFTSETRMPKYETVIQTGECVAPMRNLQPNTTYYVRPYATNSNGTTYGEVITFTTPIIKNIPCPDAPTVTDYDGNVYNTVQVGEQCWMKENLKTTHFATGAELFEYHNNINRAITPCYITGVNGYYYDYDGMMNGTEIPGVQGICPDGWHIPEAAEYITMFDALGGIEAAYDKIMVTGSNESGMSYNLDGKYFYPTLNYYSNSLILRASTGAHQYEVSNNRIESMGGDYTYSTVRCIKNTEAAVTGLPTIVIEDTVRHLTSVSNTPSAWIIYDGGKEITECGWQYGVSTTDLTSRVIPNSSDKCPIGFGSNLGSLQPNTTYYLRAYAVNENGTAYTDFVTFTTPIMMNQPCPDAPTVTDYDGNVYNTVLIGNQCWTKEDMKTTHYVTGSEIVDYNSSPRRRPFYYCTPSDSSKLYNYSTVTNGYYANTVADTIQGICPNGWHVPTFSEIQELINTLGGLSQAERKLKTEYGWTSSGTNESGFGAYPAGVYYSYNSLFVNEQYNLLSSEYPQNLRIEGSSMRYMGGSQQYGSVRCVKGQGRTTLPILDSVSLSDLMPESVTVNTTVRYDGNSEINEMGICIGTSPDPMDRVDYINSPVNYDNGFELTNLVPNTTYYVRSYATCTGGVSYSPTISFTTPAVVMNTPCPDAPMVSDMDGHWYNTVQIGNQCWMKENLRTTTYANGESISSDTMNAKFYTLPINSGYTPERYGLFYSWAAIMNGAPGNYGAPVQGICPSGWHVPSKAEWIELNNNLMGGFNATMCNMLRENSNFWTSGGGNNQSGMSIRPAGYMNYDENTASSFGYRTEFYTADMTSENEVYYVYFTNGAYTLTTQSPNEYLSSVRCIKGQGAITFPPRVEIIGYTPTTYNTADVQAKIVNDGGGITKYGMYVTTNPNEHLMFSQYVSIQQRSGNIATDATFSFNMNGLNTTSMAEGVEVYVVAFAINDVDTAFSEPMRIVIMNVPCNTSTVTDASGNSYNTVQIDRQCWMKSNLRTTKYPNGTNIETCDGSNTRYYKHVNNNSSNDAFYGLHYTWAAAMNGAPGNYGEPVQGICPNGWHIPTRAEFETLKATVGGDMSALKNTQYWQSTGNTNTSGFSLNPAGYSNYTCSTTSSGGVGIAAELITADQSSNTSFYYFKDAGTFGTNGKEAWLDAVRCIKGNGANVFAPEVQTVRGQARSYNSADVYCQIINENGGITSKGVCYSATNALPTISDSKVTSSSSNNDYSCTISGLTPAKTYFVRAFATNSAGTSYGAVDTVKIMNVSCSTSSVSLDGHSYPTVQIGGQCWLKENLRTTNGLSYLLEIDGEYYAGIYSYAYWNHNSSNIGRGVLYGRFNASDNYDNTSSNSNQSGIRGVCPAGWHIPSKAEVNELTSFLGGSSVAGGKLKSSSGWSCASGAIQGSNESGLNLTPTGYYQASTNTFVYGTTNAYFWVTDMQGSLYCAASCACNTNSVSYFNKPENDQLPIRCLKDGVAFTNIHQTETYGNFNTCSYTYTVSANFNKSFANTAYGNSSVVECGVESLDGTKFVSSSNSSINVSISFNHLNYYAVRLYVKTADGKYYYSEVISLQGCVVN